MGIFERPDREREFDASRPSIQESVRSNLPGRENGPADAYRHLLWLGELTRRFGADRAAAAGEFHELWAQGFEVLAKLFGEFDPSAASSRAMDHHNNEIGISIGLRAETWDDVVLMARGIIDASPKNGSGGPGQARWLAPGTWRKNPPQVNWPVVDWRDGIDPDQPVDYRYGEFEHHRRLEDVGPMQLEGWHGALTTSPKPTKAVEPEIMFLYADPANGGRPNLVFGGRLRNPALDRLLRERRAAKGPSGGTVHVSAHTRGQEGRPVPVEAHTRAPPAPHRR